ncbi:RNA polymerase alpha subunit [Tanacetum coccineum]
MEKDSEIYRGKKERVKSIILKAKKESSDDETLTSESDDEEYAMAVRNFKKFFRRIVNLLGNQEKKRKGQADTIGIAMRRALLGEIEGTCITRTKFEKISHEYSTIMGIQKSVHEILMNLKEIVLRSNLYGTCEASICVRGPGYATAQDIILPPYVEIVGKTQHIATLTEPIELVIGLQIEKKRGFYKGAKYLSRWKLL